MSKKLSDDLQSLIDEGKKASPLDDVAAELEKNFKSNWDNPGAHYDAKAAKHSKVKPSALVKPKSKTK